jgi:hypothetical protein
MYRSRDLGILGVWVPRHATNFISGFVLLRSVVVCGIGAVFWASMGYFIWVWDEGFCWYEAQRFFDGIFRFGIFCLRYVT